MASKETMNGTFFADCKVTADFGKMFDNLYVGFVGKYIYGNELEYIKGEIWANVYGTDQIVRIDPATGFVKGVINLKGILPAQYRTAGIDVLNGIAFEPGSGAVYVTGKYWPKMYRITLVEKK